MRGFREDIQTRKCPLCNNYAVKLYQVVARRYANVDYSLHLGQCCKCKFIFLLNNPNIKYDEEYIYCEHVVTVGDYLAGFRARERIAAIARFVPPISQSRFLDIGIGDGLLLSLADNAGYTVFGLDINPDGTEIARKQYGLQADIRLDPLERVFSDEKFDVIHMNEVIEHIIDPMSMLKWCRTHLRVSGILVIQTGNIDSLVSRVKGSCWSYFRPVHVSYFSTRTLSYAVQQAEFKIVKLSTIDWRFKQVVTTAYYLLKNKGIIPALLFFVLYVTALPHGIRRSVLIYAK